MWSGVSASDADRGRVVDVLHVAAGEGRNPADPHSTPLRPPRSWRRMSTAIASGSPPAQNAQRALFGAAIADERGEVRPVHSGGSARGYQIGFRDAGRSAVPVAARSYGQSSRIFIHRRARGERPQLPHTGSISWARQDLGHATRPVGSRGGRLTGSPSRRATSVFARPRKEPFGAASAV